jgi:hypothetical protein
LANVFVEKGGKRKAMKRFVERRGDMAVIMYNCIYM